VSDVDKIEVCLKNTKRIIKVIKVKSPDVDMIKYEKTTDKYYMTKYVNL